MVNYSTNIKDKNKMYAHQRRLMKSMSDSLDMHYNVQSSTNTNENQKTGICLFLKALIKEYS